VIGVPDAVTVTTIVAAQPDADVYLISVVPVVRPVTSPVVADAVETVATPASALLHTRPAVALVSVVELPMHIELVPVIAAGEASTVTIVVVRQPLADVYDIILVPTATPLSTPFTMPIEALPIRELTHMPPAGVLVSVAVAPTQIVPAPAIAAGVSFTVTVFVIAQPVAAITYETVPRPAETPVTIPVVLPTVQNAPSFIHVPPAVEFVSVVVLPSHTTADPPIRLGTGLTVIL
jgi:hypothetical protein